jgi:putative transposase
VYRRDRGARRALVLLLLADGRSYHEISAAMFASPSLIAAVKRDFAAGGVARVLGHEHPPCVVASWLMLIVRWLVNHTPRDFGFFRSRWSCALLTLLLWEQHRLRLSPETVRRGLHQAGFVWRRPRPVVGPRDPEHERKVRRIQRLLRHLPADETAVFQDEVDVHLNPKIGSCWMPRGEQAEVVTPGNNEKVHIAGSLHWRTGRLLVSAPGRQRNAALFVAHLDDLCQRLRSYRVIHVICDNARFHDCGAVRTGLERHAGRVVLHYLPKYAPETNPIERIWWHLHETITRNHRCQSLPELLGEVYHWIDTQRIYFTQTAYYHDTYRLAA